MQKAETYHFVFCVSDNHANLHKDHQVKPALEMNGIFNPIIDTVSLHYHPNPEHRHYDQHKYPLNNDLTMLRAFVYEKSSHKWFSKLGYTQQGNNCWYPVLPTLKTDRWGWGQPVFRWFLIMPDVTRRYDKTDEVRYKEIGFSAPPWGPTDTLPCGTLRFRVEVDWNNRTVKSPGSGKVKDPATGEEYIPASEARQALRISVRDAQYSNPIAQWATAWLNVPFILGSTRSDVENFEGVDCADLLIVAHNKAHRYSCSAFPYTYADDIAKNINFKYTISGQLNTEGDLIFWDMHGPGEQGPPDGYYDHCMISLGGNKAIWASAGWDPESGTDPATARFTKRCVVIGDYQRWRIMIINCMGWIPAPPLWRRFR